MKSIEALKEFIYGQEYDTDAFIQDFYDKTQSNLCIICDNNNKEEYILHFASLIKEYKGLFFIYIYNFYIYPFIYINSIK